MERQYAISGIVIILLVTLFFAGCSPKQTDATRGRQDLIRIEPPQLETAIFAGGCFWCIEGMFQTYEGVAEATAGYTGGSEEDATYTRVSTGKTDHYEAVLIKYDASIITYEDLLEIYWRQIDPTDPDGSFADRGPQYRSAIFYSNDEQKQLAETAIAKLAESDMYDKPIVTKLLPTMTFYPAEEYHQDYAENNEVRYKLYAKGSGREDYTEEQWGEEARYEVPERTPEAATCTVMTEEERKEKLSPMQYAVTQLNEQANSLVKLAKKEVDMDTALAEEFIIDQNNLYAIRHLNKYNQNKEGHELFLVCSTFDIISDIMGEIAKHIEDDVVMAQKIQYFVRQYTTLLQQNKFRELNDVLLDETKQEKNTFLDGLLYSLTELMYNYLAYIVEAYNRK